MTGGNADDEADVSDLRRTRLTQAQRCTDLTLAQEADRLARCRTIPRHRRRCPWWSKRISAVTPTTASLLLSPRGPRNSPWS